VNLDVSTPDEVGQGFMIENADGLIIRSNVIRAYRHVNAVDSAHLTVTNNTFASDLATSGVYGPYGVGLRNSPYATVENNIFYDLRGESIAVADAASDQGLRAGYNLIRRSDGRPPEGSPYPHDLWNVDPLFIAAQDGDYRLQESSPAIDAGDATVASSTDFDGLARPQGDVIDIGAHEFPYVKKMAAPPAARLNDPVTYTVTFVASGMPATVADVLPVQFAYVSSGSSCGGVVDYDAAARRVTYTGRPEAGRKCTLTVATRVASAATSTGTVVANLATVDNGVTPPQQASATVVLEGVRVFLPVTVQ